MKKIILLIALLVFGKSFTNAAAFESAVSSTCASEAIAVSNGDEQPKVINVVRATDGGGNFCDFTIYGLKEANGKWFFYIPYKGVNYGVRWSKEHRKFYVYIEYIRWYFWDNTLDLYAGNNNNKY